MSTDDETLSREVKADLRSRKLESSLQKKIEQYWAERGHGVTTWQERADARGFGTVHGMRSDMINGSPTQKRN